jgi:4-diphosphocytidyl-2-C-methyl-D-erythritol kinase
MVCFPNCKINVGLYVTSKRPDGYHNIETVFVPIAHHDVLEIVPAKQSTTLTTTGLPVAGVANSNLVMKAYNLLAQRHGNQMGPLDIYLHKIVPMGAGLGGGSADGAYMLHLLSDYFNLNLGKVVLASLAAELGSDCPFFVHNSPSFAMGRGELLQPIELSLSGYSVQVVCPNIHVSTAQAFKLITPKSAPYNLRDLPTLPIAEWKHHISNDFEAPVFSMHPILDEIKKQLYAGGAIYAAMTGSGSAVYGIFPEGMRTKVGVAIEYNEFYV